MVTSGSTDANGVITVSGNAANLGGEVTATANKIRLIPYIAGVAVVGTTDGGKTIQEWRCGPTASEAIPTKYLPGSCKKAD